MQETVAEGEGSVRLTSLYQWVQISCCLYWIFFLSYQTSCLNEEVNCTEPSPSARVSCFMARTKELFDRQRCDCNIRTVWNRLWSELMHPFSIICVQSICLSYLFKELDGQNFGIRVLILIHSEMKWNDTKYWWNDTRYWWNDTYKCIVLLNHH